MLQHKHLIVRAEVNKAPGPEDLDYMIEWFSDLIISIRMKILSGPHVVYSEMENNRGFTGVCVIETSHVALHTWDEEDPAILQLDVYTCSDLDVMNVIGKLDVFEPRKVEYVYLDREKNVKLLELKEIQKDEV